MNVAMRLSEEEIARAKAAPIVPRAESLTTLHREARGEWSGPCPKCGGDDRFHVSDEGWFSCRQCRDGKRGDVIELVRWYYVYDFPQAVRWLNNSDTSLPAQPQAARATARQPNEQTDAWRTEKGPILDQAKARLWEPEGAPGLEYLLGRGLEPRTLMRYEVGFHPTVPLPGTWESKARRRVFPPQPAILTPWFDRARQLTGVRARFLQWHKYTDTEGKHREVKQTSMPGSIFSGHAFGVQALFSGVDQDKDAERFRRLR